MTTPEFIIVGRVRKAHGIRGEVVVEADHRRAGRDLRVRPSCFCGHRFRRHRAATAPSCTSSPSRPFNDGLLVAFAEVADRNAAETVARALSPRARGRAPAARATTRSTCTSSPACASSSRRASSSAPSRRLYELPQGLALDVRRAPPREAETVLAPVRRAHHRLGRPRGARHRRHAARGAARVKINVVTIFPEFFAAPLGLSIPSRARGGRAASSIASSTCATTRTTVIAPSTTIRTAAVQGMVMKPEPVLRGGRCARRRRRRSC